MSMVVGSQKVQVEKYDHLEQFSKSALLERADQDNFYNAIYIVAMGKKRGLSTDGIAKEIQQFWSSDSDNDWPATPQVMMFGARAGQAVSSGTFEVLEDKPGLVKYRMSKSWDKYFGDKAQIKGVTKAEMNQIWKKMTELRIAAKGWKLN